MQKNFLVAGLTMAALVTKLSLPAFVIFPLNLKATSCVIAVLAKNFS
jgi:hypothetical protein